MNRRDFLRRAALLAAGTIAADQLDLLERLTHKRRLFPGHGFGPSNPHALTLEKIHDLIGRIEVRTGQRPNTLRMAPQTAQELARGIVGRRVAPVGRIEVCGIPVELDPAELPGEVSATLGWGWANRVA